MGLLAATIHNMRKAVEGNPKIVLYSAHDVNISACYALNFTNMQCLMNSYLEEVCSLWAHCGYIADVSHL